MAGKSTGKSSSSSRRAPAVAASVPTNEQHAPVALPSGGSFDVEKLQKGLDRVVDRHGQNRDSEVRKAFDHARDGAHTDASAPNAIPGHKLMETQTQLTPGDGGVVVTELRQVRDPDADDAGATGGAATAGGQPVTGNASEVVAMKPVDGGAPTAEEAAVPAQTGESGEPGTTTAAVGDAGDND